MWKEWAIWILFGGALLVSVGQGVNAQRRGVRRRPERQAQSDCCGGLADGCPVFLAIGVA